MKNTFKLIVVTAALLVSSLVAQAQYTVLSYSFTNAETSLLLTNRANISSIQVSSGADAITMQMFNARSLSAPYYGTNYTTSSNIVTKSVYATNWVTTFVGLNGVTNYYTNAGIYSKLSTNTSLQTNQLVPVWAAAMAGGTVATFTDLSIIAEQGIVLRCDDLADVVIYYTSY